MLLILYTGGTHALLGPPIGTTNLHSLVRLLRGRGGTNLAATAMYLPCPRVRLIHIILGRSQGGGLSGMWHELSPGSLDWITQVPDDVQLLQAKEDARFADHQQEGGNEGDGPSRKGVKKGRRAGKTYSCLPVYRLAPDNLVHTIYAFTQSVVSMSIHHAYLLVVIGELRSEYVKMLDMHQAAMLCPGMGEGDVPSERLAESCTMRGARMMAGSGEAASTSAAAQVGTWPAGFLFPSLHSKFRVPGTIPLSPCSPVTVICTGPGLGARAWW